MSDTHSSRSSAQSCFIAVCVEGHRPFLVVLPRSTSRPDAPTCPVCSAAGEFLPVAYFPVESAPRIQRVIDLVFSARVSVRAAERAVLRLDRIIAEPARGVVWAIVDDLGASEAINAFMPRDLEDNSNQLRRLVGVLKALLVAYGEQALRAEAVDGPVSAVQPSIANDAAQPPGGRSAVPPFELRTQQAR